MWLSVRFGLMKTCSCARSRTHPRHQYAETDGGLEDRPSCGTPPQKGCGHASTVLTFELRGGGGSETGKGNEVCIVTMALSGDFLFNRAPQAFVCSLAVVGAEGCRSAGSGEDLTLSLLRLWRWSLIDPIRLVHRAPRAAC